MILVNIFVLMGGTRAARDAGLALEQGIDQLNLPKYLGILANLKNEQQNNNLPRIIRFLAFNFFWKSLRI